MRSQHAVTAEGPINQLLGHSAENTQFVDSLLDGTADPVQLSEQYGDVKNELQAFLGACHNPDRTDMTWKFGIEEFQALFKKNS